MNDKAQRGRERRAAVSPNEPKRTIEEWLETINRKLDYVIAHLPSDRAYEDDRVVEEAEVWLETEKAFTAWCENEEAKGRPRQELTFENFARETGFSNH